MPKLLCPKSEISRREEMPKDSPIGKLTDAVFGFALAIGALTLTASKPETAGDVVGGVLYFCLSFVILVVIWWGTSNLMSKLDPNRSITIFLNIVLLFFVAIEPYLLNILNFSASLFPLTSSLYAIDMFFLMGVSAALCHILVKEGKEKLAAQELKSFRRSRNNQLVFACLFLLSTLPQFLEWTLSGISARVLLWLATLSLSIAASRRKDR
jgi:uncharacterized membrane protein